MSKPTISPCSFREAGGTYIIARFSDHGHKFSIRFYFDKDGWDRARNHDHLLLTHGKCRTEWVMKLLETHQEGLFKRAKTKLLNLSKIDQYAKHNVRYFKEDRQYLVPVTAKEMSDPKYKPILVFQFGAVNLFMLKPESDEYFKITRFYFPYRRTQTPGLIPVAEGDHNHTGYLRPEDYAPLDPDDAYVREKIRRALEQLI